MIKDPTGIIIIVIGFLFWIKPLVVAFIQLRNTLRGQQTNITPMTIWYYRICGLIAVIAGFVILISGK